jgi:hypothetical protein
MTFLPIVDRELRTRSRRLSTFWIRTGAAAFSSLAAGGFLVMGGLFGRGQLLGPPMFATLSWLALGYCLLEGARNTADCLSEEKREGTLGLLFLTDLKGYDVVLGKLVAGALNSFYGLLAALPLLALPILVGGVTAGEFWRVTLALGNALLVALACGLWASTRQWELGRAWAATIGLLALWLIGPLMLHGLLRLIAWSVDAVSSFSSGTSLAWPGLLRDAGQSISFASPVTSFTTAFAAKYAASAVAFWCSLGLSPMLAVLCLALASRQLPRRWQQAPGAPPQAASQPTAPPPTRNVAAEAARRASWLEANPVAWLTLRGQSAPGGIWLLVVGAVTMCLVASLLSGGAGFMLSNWLVVPFEFGFKAWLAVRACSLLSEARKSGALELLLVTPLGSREILRGQLLALRQLFFWPAATMVGSYVLFAGLQLAVYLVQEPTVVNGWYIWLIAMNHPLSFCTGLLAVTFVGLRLALTLKKPGQAAGLTLLWVVVAPAFLVCLPNLLIHLAFILWARYKLEEDMRWVAARTGR